MEVFARITMGQVSPNNPVTVSLGYAGDSEGRHYGLVFQATAETTFDLEIWRQYSPFNEELLFRSWLPRRSYNVVFPRPLFHDDGFSPLFVVNVHRFGVWESQTATMVRDYEQNRGLDRRADIHGYGIRWPWRYYWGDAIPGIAGNIPWDSERLAIMKIDPPATATWSLYTGSNTTLPLFHANGEPSWQSLKSSISDTFVTPPLDEVEAVVLQGITCAGVAISVAFADRAVEIPARLKDLSIINKVGAETVYKLTFEYDFV